MLNVALPKGRLGDVVCKRFFALGHACAAMAEDNRKLVFESDDGQMRFLLVKPSDVAIYVEHGAADVGVVGKDILLEGDYDVYELLDLNVGRCRLCVAGRRGYVEDRDRVLKVATKYVQVAKRYYASLDREIELIRLNGSIELAPILRLSDVIVDIVESGKTLEENDLKVLADIVPVSARLIANRSSYLFKEEAIDLLCAGLREVCGQ